ncbi:MAG: hypothetical protein ACOX5G_02995 [Kiritimatiellia bacterium]|jgi:hypothetical protein
MKKLLCLGLMMALIGNAGAGNWYFSPDGDDGNYGNVLSAPRRSVNAWLGLYRFRSGDTIYLLPGTHDRIDWGFHGDYLLKITFVGIKADGSPADPGEVVLTGGGTNTCCRMVRLKDFSFRNITFRDGWGDGCRGGALNGQDGSYTGTATLVSNCVFESCSSTLSGGAIWFSGGSPTFMDCTFRNCKAKAVGAVDLSSCTSAVSFVRCTFDSNAATNGAAGAVSFGHNGNETVTFGARLDGCLFTNNTATTTGGAFVGLVENATDTSFVANRAGTHGGVWYYSGYASGLAGDYALTNTFVDCTFAGNHAVGKGGVFSHAYPKRFRFTDCEFIANGSDSSGGILQPEDTGHREWLRAEGCRFERNQAKGNGVFGLGSTFEDTVLSRCAFVNNAATNGSFGVMSAGYAEKEISTCGFVMADCVFSNNTATADGGVFGGLVKSATNCVFHGNHAANGGVYSFNGYASGTYSGHYTLTNTFEDCRFERNTAGNGAVFETTWTKRFRLDRCTIASNTASANGTLYYGRDIFDYNFRLVDCDVAGNGGASMFAKANENFSGVPGGYTQDGPVFAGTAFRDNTVTVYSCSGLPGRFERCRFTGNSGARVLDLVGSQVYIIRNCLFAENQGTHADGGVVGLEWQVASRVKFENNTLVDNVAATAPYAVWTDGWCTTDNGCSYKNNVFYGNAGAGGTPGSQVPPMINTHAANCWFQTGASSIANGTRGNIVGTDPGFVPPEQIARHGVPKYMPRRSSVLRRNGAVLDWMDAAALDLAGNPRVEDGTVAIGCYQCAVPQDGTAVIVR